MPDQGRRSPPTSSRNELNALLVSGKQVPSGHGLSISMHPRADARTIRTKADALYTFGPEVRSKHAFLMPLSWSRVCVDHIWDAQRAVVRGSVMVSNILVVYKKNFEEVHGRSLEEVRSVLDSLVSERGSTWATPRGRP